MSECDHDPEYRHQFGCALCVIGSLEKQRDRLRAELDQEARRLFEEHTAFLDERTRREAAEAKWLHERGEAERFSADLILERQCCEVAQKQCAHLREMASRYINEKHEERAGREAAEKERDELRALAERERRAHAVKERDDELRALAERERRAHAVKERDEARTALAMAILLLQDIRDGKPVSPQLLGEGIALLCHYLPDAVPSERAAPPGVRPGDPAEGKT